MLAVILSFTAEGEKLNTRLEAILEAAGFTVQRQCFGRAAGVPKDAAAIEDAAEVPEVAAAIEGAAEIAGGTAEPPGPREFVGRAFSEARLLIFIGACGIAVRMIAPWLKDKRTDPAVLVMDERGSFVIPLLSGHLGGANRYATWIAGKIGAVPVITTATDLEGRFAPDLFAQKYHLKIRNPQDAKAVAAAGLSQGVLVRVDVLCKAAPAAEAGVSDVIVAAEDPEKQTRACGSGTENSGRGSGAEGGGGQPCVLISSGEQPPKYGDPQCVLTPANLIVGAGCRRGTDAEKIIAFVREVFRDLNRTTEAIACFASIAEKENEPGLIAAAEYFDVPFSTWRAEELNRLAGAFTASEFVRSRMGTDNVCERSAACAGKEEGRFLMRKRAKEGMTLAVYEVPVQFETSCDPSRRINALR